MASASELASQKEWVASAATTWPYGLRLPALDILRLMTLDSRAIAVGRGSFRNMIDLVVRAALDVQDAVSETGSLAGLVQATAVSNSAQVDANKIMMAMRAVANAFNSPQGQQAAVTESEGILALMRLVAGVREGEGPIGTGNRNLQVSLATATFNYSCFAYRQTRSGAATDLRRLQEEELVQLAETVGCMMHLQSDAEVLFRALMALGMLLLAEKALADVLKAVVVRRTNVRECVDIAKSKSSDRRVRGVADECLALLG